MTAYIDQERSLQFAAVIPKLRSRLAVAGSKCFTYEIHLRRVFSQFAQKGKIMDRILSMFYIFLEISYKNNNCPSTGTVIQHDVTNSASTVLSSSDDKKIKLVWLFGRA